MSKDHKEIAIARSEENWKAMELLVSRSSNSIPYRNVAVSRLYYSVLQLVFAEMCCHDNFSLGASTESHHLARAYMKNRYGECSRKFRDLERYRNQADYESVPISEKDLRDILRIWNGELTGLRKKYLDNLNGPNERVII